MLVVVSYDVSTETTAGRRRLRRVAKICKDFGQRVQNSVFECLVDPEQWTRLRAHLLEAYDGSEDSLRFYFLGKSWRNRKEHHGAKAVTDPEDPPHRLSQSRARTSSSHENPRRSALAVNQAT